MPDIKTVNKAVEIGLKAWAKAIDPPLLVQDDGVIGRVRMTPGGISVVRNDAAIRPLQIGTNWQITDMKENQLRTAIRQAYYSDQLQLNEGPQMTATEVQVRYELMQRLLGPTLGRFQSEFLNPLIERVFGIMLRNDALMDTPEAIEEETNLDIEYVGPLARSQRMEEAMAIDRLYTHVFQVAQADPSVLDLVNNDAAMRAKAELLGVPKSVLRSQEDVENMREQKALQAQQQQEMMMAQQQSEIMKNQGQAAGNMADPRVQEMVQGAISQLGGEEVLEEEIASG